MRLGALIRERLVEPVRRAQGTPASIARGAALGMWIALTPTVGVQMGLAAALAIPLRANIPVSLALCWVSNPVTMLPLYFAYYWLGALVVAEPSLSFDQLARRFDSATQEADLSGMLARLVEDVGWPVLWPMLVGSFIMATAVAVPTYHLVLLWAQRRAARRQLERIAADPLEQAGGEAVQGSPPPPPPPDPAEVS